MARSTKQDDSSSINDAASTTPKQHSRAYSVASAAKSLFRGSGGGSNLNLSSSNLPPLSKSASSNSDNPPVISITPSSITEAGEPMDAQDTDTVDDAVAYLNIMQVVRRGSKSEIHTFLTGDSPDVSVSQKQAMLHVAAMCASPSIVDYILPFYTKDRPWLDINSRDSDGNTALHLATKNRRAPVVASLLQRSDINVTIVNNDNEAPGDIDTSDEIRECLGRFRLAFQRSTNLRISELVAKNDYDQLRVTLADPRVLASVDLADLSLVTDEETKSTFGTLLHEAARKGDGSLIAILLDAGADQFVRDRHGKGKRPNELTRSESIRVLFKQAKVREKHAPIAVIGETPLESKESREMRGYLKKWTNYRSGYKIRWVVLENGMLSYYKNEKDASTACRGAINMRIATLRVDPHDKFKFELHGPERSSVKYHLKANTETEAKRWIWVLQAAILWAEDEKREQNRQAALVDAAVQSDRIGLSTPNRNSIIQSGAQSKKSSHLELSSGADVIGADASRVVSRGTGNPHFGDGSDDDDEDMDDDMSSTHDHQATLQDSFARTIQSARMELQVMNNLHNTFQSSITDTSSPQYGKAVSAYETSTASLREMIDMLEDVYTDNEQSWKSQLQMWEDTITRYDREQEKLQAQMGISEDKRKRQKRLLKVVRDGSGVLSPTGPSPPDYLPPAQALAELDLAKQPQSTEDKVVAGVAVESSPAPLVPRSHGAAVGSALLEESDSSDEEDDDEFFDAINDGTVEVADVVPEPVEKKVEHSDFTDSLIAPSFKGYEDPIRTHLKLDKDNRPKISLWAILKSMIGKDMTKMTLPVSFNEPTSLLHRVAEDMEYSRLLDTAASLESPTDRLLYVSAFAASEYASTTGRVAKPFNPLLAETFEYVRPDRGFRFFIEQVSHHPPVSAAYAQSDKWEYWGESAVKSVFYGPTFDINPLGTWFLRLKPSNGPAELYTWKKVTSSVVGIITGSPAVQNYGIMRIENHTLGHVAEVEFKQRGWGLRSNAFRVSGQVSNVEKEVIWDIYGTWNNQIFFKPPTETELTNGTSIWQANPRVKDMPFNLTSFAVTFNSLPDKLAKYLPPTDSRFRPDQRAMEEGEYDLAADEKDRLEVAQRQRRKARDEEGGEPFKARWFNKTECEVTGKPYWQFTGEYWTIREKVANGEMTWADAGLEDIYPQREPLE